MTQKFVRRRFNLLDLQGEMLKRGELVNDSLVATKSENKLGQALIDKGIRVIPDFKVNGKSYDFKVFHYPILIEVDGGIHNNISVKLKDYRKERYAQKRGFRILRFLNFEVKRELGNCVADVENMIQRCGMCAREIQLYPYTVQEQLKDWLKRIIKKRGKKMKPSTRFMKAYYKLPVKARKELVFGSYGKNPMSLNVIALEVRGKTKLGEKVLNELGFYDD